MNETQLRHLIQDKIGKFDIEHDCSSDYTIEFGFKRYYFAEETDLFEAYQFIVEDMQLTNEEYWVAENIKLKNEIKELENEVDSLSYNWSIKNDK